MMPSKKPNRANYLIKSQCRNRIGEIIHCKDQRESIGLIMYLSPTLPIVTDHITLFLYRQMPSWKRRGRENLKD